MPGTPLPSRERAEVHAGLIEDREASWAVFGRRNSRCPTTVMRDVVANGGRLACRPASADLRAGCCRRRHRESMGAAPGVLHERFRGQLQRYVNQRRAAAMH
jgi:hypothetical protein